MAGEIATVRHRLNRSEQFALGWHAWHALDYLSMFGRLASHSSSVRLVDRASDQKRRTYLHTSWLKIQNWSRLALRSRIAQGDRSLEVEDARCAFVALSLKSKVQAHPLLLADVRRIVGLQPP